MKAGNLDRRVVILEDEGASRSGSGKKVEDWQPVATVWAGYEAPELGREPYTADQHAAFTDAVLTLRWRSDLQLNPAKHRILFDGRTYNVVGVTEIGRREGVRVVAKARAEAGAPAA